MKSEIKANSVQWTRRFAICLFLNGLTPDLAGAGTELSCNIASYLNVTAAQYSLKESQRIWIWHHNLD